MNIVLLSVIILASIGLVAAVLLFAAAKKFHVAEDPRIDEIERLLPGANCGGCGKSGCRDLASALVKADSAEGLVCPGASPAAMKEITRIAGLEPVVTVPKMAVLACNGTCSVRESINVFDGIRSCASEAMACSGTTPCSYGCLGYGDCVSVCPYDAITMDPDTGLPVVDYDKCVGCGKCTDACPRGVMRLVPKPHSHPSVWVECINRDKGGMAMKECQASCIGCGKCMRICPEGAIAVKDFVASVDSGKCIGCGRCVAVCPRECISLAEEDDKIIVIAKVS